MVRMMAIIASFLATHVVTKPLANQSAIEKMRRLQDPLPQACIDACPGASTFYDELMALPDDGSVRQRVNLVCSHREAVECMSTGGDGFSACEGIALNQGRPTALDEVECHCNFCVSIMDRIFETTERIEDVEDLATERMPFLCQQVGLDACFLDNPEQCLWSVDSLGFNELPTAEECSAEGHPTAQFEATSNAQHTLLTVMPIVASLLFSVQPRRLER